MTTPHKRMKVTSEDFVEPFFKGLSWSERLMFHVFRVNADQLRRGYDGELINLADRQNDLIREILYRAYGFGGYKIKELPDITKDLDLFPDSITLKEVERHINKFLGTLRFTNSLNRYVEW
jgi:hypothetical protein